METSVQQLETVATSIVANIKLHPKWYGGDYRIFLTDSQPGYKLQLSVYYNDSHNGARLPLAVRVQRLVPATGFAGSSLPQVQRASWAARAASRRAAGPACAALCACFLLFVALSCQRANISVLALQAWTS